MATVTLGRTGLKVNKNGFGALPIQRVTEEAAVILKKAQQNGINFFDTAIGYSDSEEKIGYALSGVREEIYVATKTPAQTGDDLRQNLETSLRRRGLYCNERNVWRHYYKQCRCLCLYEPV